VIKKLKYKYNAAKIGY